MYKTNFNMYFSYKELFTACYHVFVTNDKNSKATIKLEYT